MAKKILALFLALSVLFTMCGMINVFAAEGDTAAAEEATGETTGETADEPTEGNTTDDDGASFDGDPIEINISSSYKQGSTVSVSGVVNDPAITLVNIQIESDDDDVFESIMKRATVDEFENGEYSYSLRNASAGAVYTLTVSDNGGTFSAKKDFVVTKSSTSNPDDDGPGDGSGKVTIWIDGYTERYVDKQTIALDQLYDDPTVLSVAEYLLDEVVDRKYRLSTDGSKIERIATTATGSTYLRDNGTTNLPKAEWMYFLNGKNYPESMADRTVKSGDEIVIYYGVPGVTGYPVVTVSPTGGLSLNDYLEVHVEQQITDPETFEVTSAPIKSAKIYLYKRNATKYATSYTTNASGDYKSSKITSSFISNYQGGSLRVAYYTTSSSKTAPALCSKDFDFVTERTGYTQASIAVEGAYNTLLEPYTPSSSAKIEEYDLYNYAMEVFDINAVDIEYEVNAARNNFTYLGTSSASKYYYHDNGDITSNSGWYVTVNGMTFGPNDNLKLVEVYTGDEIIFYFGDSDTKYIYYNIEDTLTTGSTVKAYFYYDDEFTEPISGLNVYFDGSGSSVRYRTDSNGLVRLPAVDYRGTYELQWGEHIVSGDNYLPEYVYRSVELTYTGTSKPSSDTEKDTEKTTTTQRATSSGKDPDDFVEIDEPTEAKTDWIDSRPTENPWDDGDVIGPKTTYENTPSKNYPDTNIDAWAVANIDKAHDYGLMSGTTYGYFEPLRGITRAEFTAVVARILGLDTTPENYTQVFADVSPSDWCYGVVMAAYSAGYVQGTNAVTFSPTAYITREEIAVLISRIIGDAGTSDVSSFADSANISSWAAGGVATVNKAGLMTGDQFGQFMPKDYVNRQTAATVAVRLYEYLN